MATVDGAYDCVTKTPMGDQSSVFTVISNGDSFHGTNAGAMGSLDVKDGKVDGNLLTWKMEMTVPMPMTLEAEAVVEGDTLTGTIQLGAFGSAAMTGKRRA
ncbi:hypothetical protein BH11PSE5_BH11PSE5_11130 [soil metagenome]|uniref:hypothetical protein n=1 Tax=unclassified Sphingobium TaxID=2611147 RepID=UPI001E367FA2|nr:MULTISPECIES: hypothetical protein [unclassified Sphingobium]GLI97308.1 hypothetical protein Sbs19_11260 [Sphingobium sp. BS19]CAH0351902.1 hypothetical protein SPH9361_01671 [Sphingobium sp. CECT 9361]|tara:strand:+ start:245 stop:547 length:303 start_codon:yes stop_codon:yes gene_type:complete